MAFLPLKFALATTDFAVLILLVMILIRHTSYKFDIRSWSAGFNILCVVWLAFRGAFWVLTMCSIDYWIGSTFYILFWVPMPISFGAFMLIPLFFAHLLYRVEWEYYWNKIWWIYTFTTIGLAIFMISWSILAAMNLQRDLQCINTAMVTNQSTAECYDTTYSSNAFRAVTAACFLFLACNCAVFGKRILSVNGLEASRYLGPSMEELYKVNMFLFASFLSRGLYECLDVMHVFVLPSIPLKGDEDIAFMTFFVFMLWDYFPTLVWIVTVTGRDVICTGWMTGTVSPREQSPLLSPYRDGISYDRLSELSRFGGSDTIERDRFDENALHFVSADGAQFIGSTVDSAHRARTRRKDIEEVMDGTNMLGRRQVTLADVIVLFILIIFYNEGLWLLAQSPL